MEGVEDTDNDGLANYLDLDSDGDGISDHDEAGLSLGDADRDRIDNKFDVDFTKGKDRNGDGIDDQASLSDSNNNGIADFLDKDVRVALTTLINPKVAAKSEQKAVQLAVKKTPSNTPKVDLKPEATVVIAKANTPIQTLVRTKPEVKVIAKNSGKPNTNIKPVAKAVPPTKAASPTNTKHIKAIEITDDSDGDGLSNAIELALGLNPNDKDSDGDGVPDFIEIGSNNKVPQDSDQDGKPDALDTDDDNDGILTKLEDADKNGQVTNDDTDNDGVPNYLDANDDGDSRLTKLEGRDKDTDNDGVPDYLDNSDGVSTAENAKVVVLYDEKDKSMQSVKTKTTGFNIVTKAE